MPNPVKDPVAGGRAGFAMTGYAAAATAAVVSRVAPIKEILYLVIALNHRNSHHDTVITHLNISQMICKFLPAAASEIEAEETFGTWSNPG